MPIALSSPENERETTPVIDQIAYCSAATPELRAYGLQRLVDESIQTNARADITGMLMVEGGLIFQWIEGPREPTQRLWQKIQSDPRHHCLVQLINRQQVSKRLLTGWGMRLVSRFELIGLVREAKAAQEASADTAEWAHAISTLSILIDPEFSAFYANALPAQDALPAAAHSDKYRALQRA